MDELNYITIYYMNDEQKSITVQVIHSFIFDPNNPTKQPNIEFFKLAANKARIFKIEAPINTIPYVKKWNQVVLLSYLPIDSELLLSHHDDEGD